MRNRTLNKELHEDTCIKVYNPEKQKLIAVYKTFAKAANRLGVTSSTVQHKIASKKRMHSPSLNMEVAVRCGHIKPGDEELIEKTLKYQSL